MKIAIIFFVSVLSEVFATTCLKYSEGFTRIVPSILAFLGYGVSLYLLSISLKVIPISLAYAIWSGVGIIMTVILGCILWHETIDWARGAGIFLIVCGILVINLLSESVFH